MKKSKVVVIIPIYQDLSQEDKRSLEYLRNNITKHDKVIVCPINFDLSGIKTTGFTVKRLSPGRFKTKKTGLALLMSKRFYSYFKDYDYMLYHKIGCIVFGNDEDLDKWAEKEYSYIGAPWFKKNKEKRRSVAGGIGKGSLSLRHIPSFLKIFKQKSISLTPNNRQSKQFFLEWRYWNRLKRFGSWIHLQQMMKAKGAAHHLIRKFDKPEDVFWAFFAVQMNPGFKIASFDDGYKFAIDHTPYRVYPDTLPFGITDDAWKASAKWDAIIEANAPNKAPTKKKAAVKKAPAKKKKVVKKKAPVKKKSTVTKKRTTKKKSIKKSV